MEGREDGCITIDGHRRAHPSRAPRRLGKNKIRRPTSNVMMARLDVSRFELSLKCFRTFLGAAGGSAHAHASGSSRRLARARSCDGARRRLGVDVRVGRPAPRLRLRPHHPLHPQLGRAHPPRGRRVAEPRPRRRRPRLLPPVHRASPRHRGEGRHRLLRRVRGDPGVHGPRGRARRVHARKHLHPVPARHARRARRARRESPAARGARESERSRGMAAR